MCESSDFSKPEGSALNNHTDNMHFSMLSHEDAFALLTPGSHMAKLDIRKAYRTVGVRSSQWHLLSFSCGPIGPPATHRTILIHACPSGMPRPQKPSVASRQLCAQ